MFSPVTPRAGDAVQRLPLSPANLRFAFFRCEDNGRCTAYRSEASSIASFRWRELNDSPRIRHVLHVRLVNLHRK